MTLQFVPIFCGNQSLEIQTVTPIILLKRESGQEDKIVGEKKRVCREKYNEHNQE